MSTIPLPALDVRQQAPPPDLLGEYGKAVQLKQMMQNQPLQQQALQQQVQSGQLDIEAKQREAQDAKAMQATMQQWGQPSQTPAQPGAQPAPKAQPSYDDLVPLAMKNGASFKSVQALQSHILDMKTKAATIAKDDAQTGSDKATTLIKNNGMIVDALTGALNAPDQQLPQALMQTAQQLSQQGLLDPQHLQMAQQIAQQAQSGDVAGARSQLNMYANSLGAYSKIQEEALKKLDLTKKQGEQDPNSPFYAPSPSAVAMGTAPGAAQIQAGEVAQAGRKSKAEEKAKLPGEMALAQQRQSLSQGSPEEAAKLLVSRDATLSELKARGSTPDFIVKTLAAAHRQSGGKYNAQSADAEFQVAKSPANVAFFGSAKSLTDPGGTLDQLAQVAEKIPQNSWPKLNSLEDWLKTATGNGPIAGFAATALGVADDYAKVMGGGQGSDTSRLQALNIIAAKQSPDQRAASIESIRKAVNSQKVTRIGKNQTLLKMYGDQETPAGGSGKPMTITLPSGKTVTIE